MTGGHFDWVNDIDAATMTRSEREAVRMLNIALDQGHTADILHLHTSRTLCAIPENQVEGMERKQAVDKLVEAGLTERQLDLLGVPKGNRDNKWGN